MAPEGKTSLFVEFFCWKNDAFWKMSKQELLSIASGWLEKIGLVRNEEILDSYLLKEEFVYPVYDLEYKKNLEVLLDYFDSIENLMCIGRPGRFKYTNQDHSLEMGLVAAKSIIDGKKYDIDKIGSEKDYFEKWESYSKTTK